nr:MAG TPA: hypothetical protein [Caudoviricetes sp.]
MLIWHQLGAVMVQFCIWFQFGADFVLNRMQYKVYLV